MSRQLWMERDDLNNGRKTCYRNRSLPLAFITPIEQDNRHCKYVLVVKLNRDIYCTGKFTCSCKCIIKKEPNLLYRNAMYKTYNIKFNKKINFVKNGFSTSFCIGACIYCKEKFDLQISLC